ARRDGRGDARGDAVPLHPGAPAHAARPRRGLPHPLRRLDLRRRQHERQGELDDLLREALQPRPGAAGRGRLRALRARDGEAVPGRLRAHQVLQPRPDREGRAGGGDPAMTPAEVKSAIAEGALVLDLRPPRRFATGHVPGALTMQFNRADLADRAELVLPKELALVVHAEPEPIAAAATAILREAGYDVRGHLEGGLAAWTAAGEPVAELPLLDVDELRERVHDYLVLDVRERFEFRHGHIAGTHLLHSGAA